MDGSVAPSATPVAPASPAPASPAKMALAGNARLLLIITTVNALALNAVGSLITPYLRDIGMSAAFVGTYFAVTSLVQGVASFAGGFLADSYGRRRIWILGKLMQIAAYATLATGLRGDGMVAVAVMSGLSQIGVGAMMAMQAEASQSGWRATYFAVVQTANQLISAVAPLAGGLVADRYGAGWAFLGVLPVLLLVARLVWALEEKAVKVPGSPAGGAGFRLAGVKQRLAGLAEGILHGPYPRTAVVMLVYTLLNGVSNAAIGIGMPLILRERFGMGYTGIGAMNTVSALGSATFMILGARIADRHGRRRMMVFSTAVGACLIWLAPLMASVLQLSLLIFFAPLVGNCANGAFSATNMECITADVRATFSGVGQGINSLGMAFGSILAGLAYTIHPMLPVILSAVVFSIGASLMLLFLEETGTVKLRGGDAAKPLPSAAGQ